MSKRRGHGEGSIYKRADGRWTAVVSLAWEGCKRPRKQVYGTTRAAVAKKLRSLQHEITQGLPVGDDRITVGEFLGYWAENVLPNTVKSVNTVDNYRWIVSHIIPALGPKKLRALEPDDIEALLRTKAADGYAASVVSRIKFVLGRTLAHAERRGKVARNVARLVDVPAAKPRREGRTLTNEQATTLLLAAEGDRLEALYLTGLMLGLRPGELGGLTWDDVDISAGLLHVRRAMKLERGRQHLGDLKTGRSRRTLTMPARLVTAMKVHRSRQAAERLAAPIWLDTDGLVFTTEVGTAIDPANLRRSFDRLTRHAGLGHWTPYELRHSCASLLSAAGVPIELCADVLGHTDERMMYRHYRHAVAPTVTAAVAPMERMFGAS